MTEESDLQSHTHKNDKLIITILPPNNATSYVTDKDSGDEDGLRMICNWPGSILLAPAELKSNNNNNDDEAKDDGIEPVTKKQRKTVLTQKKWWKSNMKNDLPQ